ncbi:DNA methyltransferase [Sphingomonas sp.]|jgi:site-specific DNA-methyltransferase (adenine-specific)|uniref:DNA methyltransferase n=1 Tax=Sphingomonas sp. TaxID=28214 RepID=UPI002E10E1AB|nr:DNA methyltransferase [Sphingomonas sp.]HEV7290333.1 DNA methyltransferase [Sphingomonas sp.]
MTRVTIGPATLHLGDAYTLRPTLGFHDADVTDPPYKFCATGGGRYRKKRKVFDQIVAEQLHADFDMAVIDPMLCGGAIVFSHNDQLPALLPRLNGHFHRTAVCVWQKPNPQPVANKHYRPEIEFYVHAWNRGYHPAGNMAELLRVSRIGAPRGPARFGHAITKPDALMTKILTNVRGETVCDPFMGTGSTGVAAIRAGKRFTGIEHNPAHFETAVARITAAVAELGRADAA